MRILAAFLFALAVASAATRTLDVHLIDVEGGKSVLVVTPAGESMLIDVGWPASNGREASTERIVAAVKAVGLKQIDYLVISRWRLRFPFATWWITARTRALRPPVESAMPCMRSSTRPYPTWR